MFFYFGFGSASSTVDDQERGPAAMESNTSYIYHEQATALSCLENCMQAECSSYI